MQDRHERDRIGPYEIVCWLARGGMGSVFLAQKKGLVFRRGFAVKKMHPHLTGDKELTAMFADEAAIGARLAHPNVVPVVDYGVDPDGPWMAMLYVPGASLSRMQSKLSRREGTLPLGVTLRIALDVLAGLHAAHELRDDDGRPLDVIHRDATPHNVLVGRDGFARIIDFGVARAAHGRMHATIGDVIKGKPEYLSPEQVDMAELDRRSDVFTFGIGLWEMLTGARLFAAGSDLASLEAVSRAPIRPPNEFRPVPSSIARVVMIALERDRARRYSTAAAFASELRRAARADGVEAADRDELAALFSRLEEPLSDRGWMPDTLVMTRRA